VTGVKHLGVIPDGNRRWAKEQGLTTLEGYRRGLQVADEIALAAFDRGVEYFTAYAFSTENWSRSQKEVGYLMDLFYSFLMKELRKLGDKDVRLRFLGRRDGLPDKLVGALEDAEARTSSNRTGTACVCLNYGGQTEVVDALKSMLAAGVKPEDVTPELVTAHLYGPEVPPLDLIIRTSGEQRTSGFMMWRTTYAEMYFSPVLWPAFGVADLDAALEDYDSRVRRFGG
jgi:undecaprenyl diphosphate synthase